jgi:hypothetical protein
MSRTWTDQPALLEQSEKLLETSYNGRVIELRKRSDPADGPPAWFVAVGNLFKSQTLRLPTLENAVRLVNGGRQMEELVMEVEQSIGEADEVFSFRDEDGEYVFLRAKDVAMIQFPVELVEPGLAEADDEADDDEMPDTPTPTGNA